MNDDLISRASLIENLQRFAPEHYTPLIDMLIRNEPAALNKKRKPTAFSPPTREEVREYVKSRNSNVDPDYFYDYFATGKWIDSEGKPVRNWKQKIITWEGRGDNGRKQHPANGQSSTTTGKAKSKFVYDNA